MTTERRSGPDRREAVNHPAHYGGADNPYEAIRVIEEWNLGFHLGNTVKYIARAGRKRDNAGEYVPAVEDLKKARWYLDRLIQSLEPVPREQYEPGVFHCTHCGKMMDDSVYVTTGQPGKYMHRECAYPEKRP